MAPVPASGLVDFSQKSLLVSACSIAFNPLAWNIVARQGNHGTTHNDVRAHHDLLQLTEYHNKILTRLFGGRSKTACYFLALCIFSAGIVRDLLYERALRHQPLHPALDTDAARYAGYALLLAGNVLVMSSTWALGITGTFLGDYFGILMDHMVTGFPFNVTDAPMYYGSTMSFMGTALVYGRPTGVLLTAWVFVVYKIALAFENPFTAEIYAKRERERAAAAVGDKSELKKQR